MCLPPPPHLCFQFSNHLPTARPGTPRLQAAGGLALIWEDGGRSEVSQDQTHSPTRLSPSVTDPRQPTLRSHTRTRLGEELTQLDQAEPSDSGMSGQARPQFYQKLSPLHRPRGKGSLE